MPSYAGADHLRLEFPLPEQTAAGTTSCLHVTRLEDCNTSHKTSCDGYTVHSARAAQLFRELALARADRSFSRLLRRLAQTDVLVLGLASPERN